MARADNQQNPVIGRLRDARQIDEDFEVPGVPNMREPIRSRILRPESNSRLFQVLLMPSEEGIRLVKPPTHVQQRFVFLALNPRGTISILNNFPLGSRQAVEQMLLIVRFRKLLCIYQIDIFRPEGVMRRKIINAVYLSMPELLREADPIWSPSPRLRAYVPFR